MSHTTRLKQIAERLAAGIAYDPETADYVERVFICESPCDELGKTVFSAGFARAARPRNEDLSWLLRQLELRDRALAVATSVLQHTSALAEITAILNENGRHDLGKE